MAVNRIARVVINLSLDKAFDYLIPEQLQDKVKLGSRVDVPFGRGNAHRVAYVVGLKNDSDFDLAKLKEIERVHGERPLIPEHLLGLAEWMAQYYCCAKERAVQALLPAVVRRGKISGKKRKVLRLNPDADIAQALEELGKRRAKRQIEILKKLELLHTLPLAETTRHAGAVNALKKAHLVVVEEEAVARDPFANVEILPDVPLELNEEQHAAFELITASLDKARKDVILLFGVTGSGKTEVYMQAIAECLARGLEAIMLVPEISLTPQTTERFRARFGDKISVLHSHLSDGERFDEWTRINRGKVEIVVGARSALFAPFRKPGLIIVDEEHENSYKQQDMPPRYHARDVAVMRGHRENVTVVLGSATPSLESYYNAKKGKYKLATLSKRVDNQQMPVMETVNMCVEKEAAGKPLPLSRQLVSEMRRVLDKGEQVMLFLNRRGFATQMQCLKCGFVAECEDCSVKYTYHRQQVLLLCHTCGAVRRAPETCPACGDKDIRYSGLGTERVESAVKKFFPHVRVLRMDSDTMTRKDAYREALTAFRAGRVDILIGTQMIAKGLHFPNVTLVGVIFADLSLYMPDFRAGERTFQLLVQVAGRAGRGDVPGNVIVQTYTPYHSALAAAVRLDYEAFYEEEIDVREQVGFPPCAHMILIRLCGPDEGEVAEVINEFAERLRPTLPPEVQMVNPMPCGILKKRGNYHYQLLLSGKKIGSLSRLVKQYVNKFRLPRELRLYVDVDPLSVS